MEASYEKDEVEGPLKKLGNIVDKALSGSGKDRQWDREKSTPSEAAVCSRPSLAILRQTNILLAGKG